MSALIFLACIVLFLVAVRLAQGVGGETMRHLALIFGVGVMVVVGGGVVIVVAGVLSVQHQQTAWTRDNYAQTAEAMRTLQPMTAEERAKAPPTLANFYALTCMDDPKSTFCPPKP